MTERMNYRVKICFSIKAYKVFDCYLYTFPNGCIDLFFEDGKHLIYPMQDIDKIEVERI
jgi:hypothetical protein